MFGKLYGAITAPFKRPKEAFLPDDNNKTVSDIEDVLQ